MDKNTFGKSEAAEILIEILDRIGDKKLIRKVSARIHQFSRSLHAIETIKDKKLRKTIFELYRRVKMKFLDESTLSDEVKSFVRNVMMSDFRRHFRGEINKQTRRKR